jgi:hypothetical protein
MIKPNHLVGDLMVDMDLSEARIVPDTKILLLDPTLLSDGAVGFEREAPREAIERSSKLIRSVSGVAGAVLYLWPELNLIMHCRLGFAPSISGGAASGIKDASGPLRCPPDKAPETSHTRRACVAERWIVGWQQTRRRSRTNAPCHPRRTAQCGLDAHIPYNDSTNPV